MKILFIFPTLLLYLTVSVFALADFHRDAPNGKPHECLLCMFTNTPIDATQALATIPEYVLPEQPLTFWEDMAFQEIVSSSFFLFILPSNRAPPLA
jgi:hypothetical protein